MVQITFNKHNLKHLQGMQADMLQGSSKTLSFVLTFQSEEDVKAMRAWMQGVAEEL